jgi:hypothetical protein
VRKLLNKIFPNFFPLPSTFPSSFQRAAAIDAKIAELEESVYLQKLQLIADTVELQKLDDTITKLMELKNSL